MIRVRVGVLYDNPREIWKLKTVWETKRISFLAAELIPHSVLSVRRMQVSGTVAYLVVGLMDGSERVR